MMRMASTRRALLGLAVAVAGVLAISPAVASATPEVTLKAVPVPLKGVPGSGDILGAPAAVEFEFTIRGKEVTGDAPSQLRGVNVFAPAGVKLHDHRVRDLHAEHARIEGPRSLPEEVAGQLASGRSKRRTRSPANRSKRRAPCRPSSRPKAN